MNINPDELHTPLSASIREDKSPAWDMSQERAFIENLLGQRFNFFLVFFSLVIAGSVNSKTQLHLQIILGIGTAVCVLLATTLTRSQEKLDLILDDLFSDPSHPATIINNRAKPCGSRRKVIGSVIPRLCCSLLIVGFICALTDVLQPAEQVRNKGDADATLLPITTPNKG